MEIALKRKLLRIAIFDRENNTSKIIFHNSSFPNRAYQEDVKKYEIKVSAYKIENDREFLIYKDISPIFLKEKLRGYKKIKVVFTGRNESIIDLTNFKFNSNINWSLIF